MSDVRDYMIEIYKFGLNSCNYFHFHTNNIEKVMNFLILLLMS